MRMKHVSIPKQFKRLSVPKMEMDGNAVHVKVKEIYYIGNGVHQNK